MRQMKLRVSSLAEGESLSSWLDRNAGLWGVSRPRLLGAMSLRTPLIRKDVDEVGLNNPMWEDLSKASGVDREVFASHGARRNEFLVAARDRWSYCPMCFRQDLLDERFPYFRLAWASMLLTHCPLHQCPLFRWQATGSCGTRKFPHEWYMGDFSAEKLDLPWLRRDLGVAARYATGTAPVSANSMDLWQGLIRFERTLLESGAADATKNGWECQGAARLSQAMDAMVLIASPRAGVVADAPASAFRPKFEDHDQISFTLRRYRSRATCVVWSGLRGSLTNLPCRRAVIVLAAHLLGEMSASLAVDDEDATPLGSSIEWKERLAAHVKSRHLVELAAKGHLGEHNRAARNSALR